MVGYSDISQQSKDSLEISAYYKGLVRYITGCQTPMSIAIQGEWGSGKTSIMNFIKNELREGENSFKIIEFNTWEYSQFDLGDRLPFSLMEEIITGISGGSDETKRSLLNIIKGFAAFTADSLIRVASSQIGADGVVDSARQHIQNYRETLENFDPIKSLRDLKNEFGKLVKESCPGENDKVVIFIDDLDRLQPVRAIELLECLKLFIECDRCVFILAIDFDVVSQGVAQKYQWDSGSEIAEEKAKAYFEKFIQLPFYVPINFYKTDKYIGSKLGNLIGAGGKYSIQRYKSVTKYSVGNNPRSINRLINTYALALETFKQKGENASLSEDEHFLLYILLCMQVSYELFYISFTDRMVNEIEFDIDSYLGNFNPSDYEQGESLDVIVTALKDLISRDDSDSDAEDTSSEVTAIAFDRLRELIDFTGVTAVRDSGISGNGSSPVVYNTNIDSKARYAKLESETSSSNRELLRQLEDEFRVGVHKIPDAPESGVNIKIGSQKYQYWTIYIDGKKFAEVSYGGRIGINFGRGTFGDRVSGKFYTEEWSKFAEELEKNPAVDRVKGKRNSKKSPMSYLIRDNSNPFRLTGISSPKDVSEAVNILLDAANIFVKYQNSTTTN